jgi:phage protein D
MTVDIMPNPKIIATATVQLKKSGKLSGKYYVDKVTHKVSKSGGYAMSLELHKVYKRTCR